MTVIRSLLVPVDFSPFSEAALRHAILLSRGWDATVTLLHVVPPPPPPVLYSGFAPAPLVSVETRDELRHELERFAEVARSASLTTRIELREGDIVREIVAEAASLPGCMVVMGTHGRGGFAHLLLGSVTERVLRLSPCPVFTVSGQRPSGAAARGWAPPAPRTGPVSQDGLPSFGTVLCPVDFSEPSFLAFAWAVTIATPGRSRVVLLHVMEDVPDDPRILAHADVHRYRSLLEAETLRQLHELAGDTGSRCELVTLSLLGRPWRQILAQAEAYRADLIVMGVRGRTALDLAFFGSTTNHVVRQAGCPVLTVREQPEPSA